jgi:hypothetical protein
MEQVISNNPSSPREEAHDQSTWCVGVYVAKDSENATGKKKGNRGSEDMVWIQKVNRQESFEPDS